ncbi:MAG TPA: hypothetical protein VN017_04125 [Pseudoxanthomonas sp.]|uniref:Uncharacterized protein n=1 Tax=Pseudoxanthomonas helianthi TaxID=1453541 RepID=A0A941ARK1_9GAMM|nr:hypothetical protein [Pseudoxanthomonas helianthi]MBP3983026.1 hypothetical protein [Pseudoxanthomonas helianthi]HWU70525.1 hypothetical protein [Pseudoxanthomonas sp.]
MYWLALILMFVGGIWLIVNGFRKSIWWGLGNLLIPFVALIFGLLNFAENKIPLLLYVIGVVLFFVSGGWAAGMPAPATA